MQVDILLNNAGLALGTAKVHENSIEVSSFSRLNGEHVDSDCMHRAQGTSHTATGDQYTADL